MSKISIKNLMKSKIILLCIASLVLQEVCAQNLEPIDIPITPKYGEEDTNKMINEFTQTGSCSLYDFCISYSDVDDTKLIYYSLLMADKYNCSEAYFNTYAMIMRMSKDYNYTLSEELWHFVFSYLKKAGDLEHTGALFALVSLYKKGNEYVKPEYERAESYLKKLNKVMHRNWKLENFGK